MTEFVHPTSGEVLETRAEFDAAVAELEIELGLIYRALYPIREARAERFETADLPTPRYRTSTQEKVARCPRCGGKLEDNPTEGENG